MAYVSPAGQQWQVDSYKPRPPTTIAIDTDVDLLRSRQTLDSTIRDLRRQLAERDEHVDHLESTVRSNHDTARKLNKDLFVATRDLRKAQSVEEYATTQIHESDQARQALQRDNLALAQSNKSLKATNRTCEHNLERCHRERDQDLHLWSAERSKYQRLLELADHRLELLASELNKLLTARDHHAPSPPRPVSRTSARENASLRNSILPSNRISILSSPSPSPSSSPNRASRPLMTTLADELNEVCISDAEDYVFDTPISSPTRPAFPHQSQSLSMHKSSIYSDATTQTDPHVPSRPPIRIPISPSSPSAPARPNSRLRPLRLPSLANIPPPVLHAIASPQTKPAVRPRLVNISSDNSLPSSPRSRPRTSSIAPTLPLSPISTRSTEDDDAVSRPSEMSAQLLLELKQFSALADRTIALGSGTLHLPQSDPQTRLPIGLGVTISEKPQRVDSLADINDPSSPPQIAPPPIPARAPARHKSVPSIRGSIHTHEPPFQVPSRRSSRGMTTAIQPVGLLDHTKHLHHMYQQHLGDLSSDDGNDSLEDMGPPLPMQRSLWSAQRADPAVHGHAKVDSTASTEPSTLSDRHGTSESSRLDNDALIDAIAATVVGGWMWKCPRKPKGAIKTWQQRWMWISLEDKTIMWSSKEPKSDAALAGTPARTVPLRTIVDDVTEVTDVSFGRCIVVSSAERALKFSTASAEQHYSWLAALSFVADSRQTPSGSQVPSESIAQTDVEKTKTPAPKLRRKTLTKRISSATIPSGLPMSCLRSQDDGDGDCARSLVPRNEVLDRSVDARKRRRVARVPSFPISMRQASTRIPSDPSQVAERDALCTDEYVLDGGISVADMAQDIQMVKVSQDQVPRSRAYPLPAGSDYRLCLNMDSGPRLMSVFDDDIFGRF